MIRDVAIESKDITNSVYVAMRQEDGAFLPTFGSPWYQEMERGNAFNPSIPVFKWLRSKIPEDSEFDYFGKYEVHFRSPQSVCVPTVTKISEIDLTKISTPHECGQNLVCDLRISSLSYYGPPGLSIYSVADPYNPQLIYNGDDWTDKLDSEYFSGDTYRSIYYGKKYIILTSNKGMITFIDIQDPKNPTIIYQKSRPDLIGSYSEGNDGTLYLIDNHWRSSKPLISFKIVDIQNQEPKVIGESDPISTNGRGNAIVKDNYSYIVGLKGQLYIFDITHPDKPILVEKIKIAEPRLEYWCDQYGCIEIDYSVSSINNDVEDGAISFYASDKPYGNSSLFQLKLDGEKTTMPTVISSSFSASSRMRLGDLVIGASNQGGRGNLALRLTDKYRFFIIPGNEDEAHPAVLKITEDTFGIENYSFSSPTSKLEIYRLNQP